MEKIVKKDGYVYLVKNWEQKGFETFYNLGKDPDCMEKKTKKKNEEEVKKNEEEEKKDEN